MPAHHLSSSPAAGGPRGSASGAVSVTPLFWWLIDSPLAAGSRVQQAGLRESAVRSNQ